MENLTRLRQRQNPSITRFLSPRCTLLTCDSFLFFSFIHTFDGYCWKQKEPTSSQTGQKIIPKPHYSQHFLHLLHIRNFTCVQRTTLQDLASAIQALCRSPYLRTLYLDSIHHFRHPSHRPICDIFVLAMLLSLTQR